MQPTPQPENEINANAAVVSAAAVRDQLNRLLAHPLFANSKRYPVLLAYTVEQVLLGKADELKERTIGVEAFGREPDYDVALDPVVRATAAEVRKRLVQYYYNPEHAGELLVELPLGSYIPNFKEQFAGKSHPEVEAAVPEAADVPVRMAEAVPSSDENNGSRDKKWGLPQWASGPLALPIAVLFGIAIGVAVFPLWRVRTPSNLERFWAPVTGTSSRVTYCLGEPTESVDLQVRTTYGAFEDGSLNVYDVVTLARSIAPLVPRNGEFRVLPSSATGFAQLREGPFVLIGAFDNAWTLRVTQNLPFGFVIDNHVRKIVDRKSKPGRFWTLRWEVPNSKVAEDYAIIARIHDGVTGQPVIVLAGILGEGTQAASEVVSNPDYLNQLLQKVPRDWDRLNMEAVVQTHVIDGHPGPPTIVAVETWQ